VQSVARKRPFVKFHQKNLAVKIIDFIFDQPFIQKRFLNKEYID